MYLTFFFHNKCCIVCSILTMLSILLLFLESVNASSKLENIFGQRKILQWVEHLPWISLTQVDHHQEWSLSITRCPLIPSYYKKLICHCLWEAFQLSILVPVPMHFVFISTWVANIILICASFFGKISQISYFLWTLFAIIRLQLSVRI